MVEYERSQYYLYQDLQSVIIGESSGEYRNLPTIKY